MTELVLILPLPPSPDDRLAMSAHLARARVTTLGASHWRAWLAADIGREDLAGVPAATLVANGAADAWFATPVHLHVGLDRVQMSSEGWLDLDEASALGLEQDFSREFTSTGLTLEPCGAEGFLLRGLHAPGAGTTDPATMLGRDIGASLASGDHAAPLRRLAGEIEMWLHAHPVNRARGRAGLPAVSTLWIWGGGVATNVALNRIARGGGYGRAHGSDAWLRALWGSGGGDVSPAPWEGGSAAWVWRGRDLADALRRATLALSQGSIGRVRVITGSRQVLLSRSDRWKAWRRPFNAEAL